MVLCNVRATARHLFVKYYVSSWLKRHWAKQKAQGCVYRSFSLEIEELLAMSSKPKGYIKDSILLDLWRMYRALEAGQYTVLNFNDSPRVPTVH